MNKNELIIEGLVYTVMGVLVVFMILVIIMIVIKAMALFGGKSENTVAPQQKKEDVPEASCEKKDNNAIIAVITAAIAAVLGKNATGFKIRSYRKIQDGEWNKAGRRDVLNNRI